MAKVFDELDARGGRGGAEDRDAARSARVGHAGRRSGVGTDDDKVDRTVGREPGDGAGVLDIERHVLRDIRGPPVARRDDDLDVGVVALAHPRERMLAAPTPDDEDPHYSHSMVDGGLLDMS